MGKETKNKSSGLFTRVWKWLIGLEPGQSIDSLSRKEIYEFYASLGLAPLGVAILMIVVLFILSTTIGLGMYDTAIGILLGVVVLSFLVKWCCERYDIYQDDDVHEVHCTFWQEQDGKGYLEYNGQRYPVDDFVMKDGKLCELLLVLYENYDNEQYSSAVIFYLEDEKVFMRRTERQYVLGLTSLYKVVSWIAFFVILIAILVMAIGIMVVVF